MRVKVIVAMGLGVLIWWGATDECVAWTGLTKPDGPPSPQTQSNSSSTDAFSEQEKAAVIEAYASAARKNGYETSVVTQPDGRIIALKLTKIGKTDNGHGILEKKWDEQDTIDLTLSKQAGGVSILSVSHDVMVRPPIGDWIKRPSNAVPAWVVVPAASNG